MRRLVLAAALLGAGCASQERQIPPGSTVIYDSAQKGGPDWFSFCDARQNLIYLSKDKSQPIAVIQGGCAPPAAPAPTPAPPPVAAPAPEPPREPVVIQILPAPGTVATPAPKAAPKVAPPKTCPCP